MWSIASEGMGKTNVKIKAQGGLKVKASDACMNQILRMRTENPDTLDSIIFIFVVNTKLKINSRRLGLPVSTVSLKW